MDVKVNGNLFHLLFW